MPTSEIELTWAASSTPDRASRVTVAGWPTWTLLMSDSLNATVMVSVFVLTISANAEADPDPEFEEPDEPDEPEPPPRLPAVVPVPLPEELLEDVDPFDEDELPAPPPETASPGDRLDSDAIVPLTGAYSLVLFTPTSALCTPACAE